MSRTTSIIALAALMAPAAHASAQTSESPAAESSWQFIVNSGTIVPTGSQRDALRRGNVTVAQLSHFVRPSLALTASFGWGRTRDIATAGDPKVDMFTYDVGAELRASRRVIGHGVTISPFAGAGVGGRSYNYRSLHVDATHNLAGYAGVGGEVGIGRRVQVRLEARDYLSGFRSLDGSGGSRLGNDVTIMAGLRLRVRG